MPHGPSSALFGQHAKYIVLHGTSSDNRRIKFGERYIEDSGFGVITQPQNTSIVSLGNLPLFIFLLSKKTIRFKSRS
jgi:hypothetical protein